MKPIINEPFAVFLTHVINSNTPALPSSRRAMDADKIVHNFVVCLPFVDSELKQAIMYYHTLRRRTAIVFCTSTLLLKYFFFATV